MIANLGVLPEGAAEELLRHVERRSLGKSEFFAREGEIAEHVAFIGSGILRMFYVRSDGREFNRSFLKAGDFCGVLDSLVLGEPGRLYIDALEPVELLVVAWAELEALYDQHPYWSRIGRRFAERLAIKKMGREASLLLDDPEQRYLAFRREHAAIEARIADYHVASYIGVTPEALSRIKKRISL